MRIDLATRRGGGDDAYNNHLQSQPAQSPGERSSPQSYVVSGMLMGESRESINPSIGILTIETSQRYYYFKLPTYSYTRARLASFYITSQQAFWMHTVCWVLCSLLLYSSPHFAM